MLYFDDSMIWIFRSGKDDDPYVPIWQTLRIKDGVVLLEEIPDDFVRPLVAHDSISFTEIHEGDPDLNQYRILYKYGIIVFHHDHNGELVTINYKGTGRFYLPAERIYLHLNDKNDVKSTLQNLLDDNEAAIEAITTLAGLVGEINEFEHKGTYSSAVTYKKRSVVDDGNGNSYMAVIDSKGKSLSDVAYWRVIAKKGTKGDTGAKGDKPAHQWVDTTKLQFEKPEGGWSAAVELKGAQGIQGLKGDKPGHQWVDTTKLQFEKPEGGWGTATELKGAKGDQGTKGINWKGNYGSSVTYAIDDAVFYSTTGNTYICIQGAKGKAPTDTSYWNILAQKGADGAGVGDVVGPGDSIDGNIVLFNGITGKLIKDSGSKISSLEPSFTKNTAFNKNFGYATGTVAKGEDLGNIGDLETTENDDVVSAINELNDKVGSQEYGGRFAWQYDLVSDSLDLVVID